MQARRKPGLDQQERYERKDGVGPGLRPGQAGRQLGYGLMTLPDLANCRASLTGRVGDPPAHSPCRTVLVFAHAGSRGDGLAGSREQFSCAARPGRTRYSSSFWSHSCCAWRSSPSATPTASRPAAITFSLAGRWAASPVPSPPDKASVHPRICPPGPAHGRRRFIPTFWLEFSSCLAFTALFRPG